MVSGTISLPSRGAFHLSLTVLVHYRSLGSIYPSRWSSRIPTGFHVSRLLRILNGENQVSSTGLSPSLVWLPSHFDYLILSVTPKFSPATPTEQAQWFGLFPFRSPLLRESNFFLFLPLLRCFSSLRLPLGSYEFTAQ